MTPRTRPEGWSVRWCLAMLLLSLAACAGVSAREGLTSSQVSRLPAEVAPAYEVFAARCSRCHTLSRPLAANVSSKEHWRSYVTRMRRTPGSGISPADAEIILVFLGYWSAEENRAHLAGENR